MWILQTVQISLFRITIAENSESIMSSSVMKKYTISQRMLNNFYFLESSI